MNEEVRHKLITLLGEEVSNTLIKEQTLIDRIMESLEKGNIYFDLDSDERLTLPEVDGMVNTSWVYHKPKNYRKRVNIRPCKFLLDFLYYSVYQESRIPFGCMNCYKVKVELSNVYALTQFRELSKGIPWSSKCGPEVHHEFSQSLYSAFFYVDGLAEAYQVYDLVIDVLTGNESLKSQSKVSIKRGCTNYEMTFGPSDKWEVDDKYQVIEDALYKLYKPVKQGERHMLHALANWMSIAYKIGDDSYLKLTNNKRLFPKAVDYSKERDNAG